MARVHDLPLQIERRLSEGCGRFAGRASPGGVETFVAGDDAHPFAAATTGWLE